MDINKIIQERSDRLYSLPKQINNFKPLMAEIRLDDKIYLSINNSVKVFLYDCLSEYFTKHIFNIDLPLGDFIKKYSSYLLELPNITPNGLVLPKKEIVMSYNLLLKSISNLYSDIGLDKTCVSAACPINLRINFGTKMKSGVTERPKSSTIWHSDIWAGQNSNEVMLHTPIFGDFVKNGILLALPPQNFFPHFVKNLDSFSEGQCLYKDFSDGIYNPEMRIGYSYLVDSFLLHKTLNADESFRGIVSFPIRVNQISSDIYKNSLRDEEFQDSSDFIKFGKERLVYTNKSIKQTDFIDQSTGVYVDKFEFINI